jgi:hydrogenase maturation protein HypF
LAGTVDFFLHHDRPIVRPIDDSVVRIIAGRAVTIRLARGIAPLLLELPAALRSGRHLLAVGGQQKGAIALFNGCQAHLGPHVGDLDQLLTRDRFVSHVRDLCQLFGARPELIVHDAHPDYFTTRWAIESRLPTVSIQHHHAHVVAGMIEQGWLDREVLGVAWDGTGHGPDGTIWGGEFLRATASGYRRVGRLRPFPLFGGETAIREPWRTALAVMREAIGTDAALEFLVERGFDRRMLERLLGVAARPGYAPLTSSVGRLFDAIAAWLLLGDAATRGFSRFEGQSAMLLEAACGDASSVEADERDLPLDYRIPIASGEPHELDWRPLVSALAADFQRGLPLVRLAIRFHASLADAVFRMAELHSGLPVVLGGGVFQNRILTEMIARRMAGVQQLGLPGVIPPNDGGLAAGQLAIALARVSAANPRG